MSDYNNIRLKRVYDKAEKSDGVRLLADRLWPRGIKKTALDYDDWIKELCPSHELRKAWHQGDLSHQAFEKQYREELVAQPEALNKVAWLAAKAPVTLLSAAKSLESSHLPILKKALLQALEDNDFNSSEKRSSPVCYNKP